VAASDAAVTIGGTAQPERKSIARSAGMGVRIANLLFREDDSNCEAVRLMSS
jgi:hypothetical protein